MKKKKKKQRRNNKQDDFKGPDDSFILRAETKVLK